MFPTIWIISATPTLDGRVFEIGVALVLSLTILRIAKQELVELFRRGEKSETPPNHKPIGIGYLPPIEVDFRLKIGRNRKLPRSYYPQLQPKQIERLPKSLDNSRPSQPETLSSSDRKD
jgi:hypothetical protein